MPVISFRVTNRERHLRDIVESTGTNRWYERLISYQHIPPREADKLVEAGLIRVRWFTDPAVKRALGLERCRRVGAARITKAGREWLDGNAVAPIIGVLVEGYARRLSNQPEVASADPGGGE